MSVAYQLFLYKSVGSSFIQTALVGEPKQDNDSNHITFRSMSKECGENLTQKGPTIHPVKNKKRKNRSNKQTNTTPPGHTWVWRNQLAQRQRSEHGSPHTARLQGTPWPFQFSSHFRTSPVCGVHGALFQTEVGTMKPSYSGCWEPASLSHRLPKETQVGAAELHQTLGHH